MFDIIIMSSNNNNTYADTILNGKSKKGGGSKLSSKFASSLLTPETSDKEDFDPFAVDSSDFEDSSHIPDSELLESSEFDIDVEALLRSDDRKDLLPPRKKKDKLLAIEK